MKGEHTLDSILLLHQQVKQNAQSVPTVLGGGKLGYLALVISDKTYHSISNSTPFERLHDPGQLQVHLSTSPDTNANVIQTPVLTS